MLDTNTCIYILKKRALPLLEKFESAGNDQICLSVITYAELNYGVAHSQSKKLNQIILSDFVSRLEIMPWNSAAAEEYGRLRVYLEKKGTPIGNMDLLIAAHALSEKCVLVTNNLREFKRVPHLKYEDWSL
jgi:tRNA(fMet)-specific endonuclease VapC